MKAFNDSEWDFPDNSSWVFIINEIFNQENHPILRI